MIKLQVIGHLGRDAVVNNVNGRNVVNFTVAHSEKYKDAQGVQKDRTTWVDCAYWTDRTAIAPYLKKGTQIYVEGIPDVRSYTTQDGRNGASLTLRVNNIQLLGGRPDGTGGGYEGASASGGSYQNAASPNNYQAGPSIPASGSVSGSASVDNSLDDLPF